MPVIAALSLVLLQYSIPEGARFDYKAVISLEGFMPVFGGTEGAAKVDFDLKIVGGKSPKTSEVAVSSEIVGFRATFNEAELPLDLDSVTTYFPKTNIRMTSFGRMLATDAPEVSLPIRLPGLDVKRFPDVTYVPIEFPEKTPAIGEEWSFSRKFGESDVKYRCTLAAQEREMATVNVEISQEYETLENAALELTTKHEDAERRVVTKMSGTGKIVFDQDRGIVKSAYIVTESLSKVTEFVDGSNSERKLTTTFDVRLVEGPPTSKARRVSLASRAASYARLAWSRVVAAAQSVWSGIVSGTARLGLGGG